MPSLRLVAKIHDLFFPVNDTDFDSPTMLSHPIPGLDLSCKVDEERFHSRINLMVRDEIVCYPAGHRAVILSQPHLYLLFRFHPTLACHPVFTGTLIHERHCLGAIRLCPDKQSIDLLAVHPNRDSFACVA